MPPFDSVAINPARDFSKGQDDAPWLATTGSRPLIARKEIAFDSSFWDAEFFNAVSRYGVTAPLVAPFAKILPNWIFSGFVVDFATVAALIVFALAGSLLLMLFSYPRKEPASVVVMSTDV
jgi:hypothetical protein